MKKTDWLFPSNLNSINKERQGFWGLLEQKHPGRLQKGIFGQCAYLDTANYLPYLSLEMFACTLHSLWLLPRPSLHLVCVCVCVCVVLSPLSSGLWQHREQRSQGQRVLSGSYLLRDWRGAQTPPGTTHRQQGTDCRQTRHCTTTHTQLYKNLSTRHGTLSSSHAVISQLVPTGCPTIKHGLFALLLTTACVLGLYKTWDLRVSFTCVKGS